MFCPKCGKKLEDNSVMCSHCSFRFQQTQFRQMQYQQSLGAYQERYMKKKDSPLSLVSAIFGILDFLFGYYCAVVALVAAIIDLVIHNKTQRHLGSWVGIAFACIRIIIIGIVWNGLM